MKVPTIIVASPDCIELQYQLTPYYEPTTRKAVIMFSQRQDKNGLMKMADNGFSVVAVPVDSFPQLEAALKQAGQIARQLSGPIIVRSR